MTKPGLPQLSGLMIAEAVRAALREDLGRAGDITTAATIPEAATARANVVARNVCPVVGEFHAKPLVGALVSTAHKSLNDLPSTQLEP